MSSFSARPLEVWRSSLAESMSPIAGAFSFEVLHTIMVPQTLQFLAEKALQGGQGSGEVIPGFLAGMRYANSAKPTSLLLWKNFPSAVELFSFNVDALSDAIRQLELHADINLTFARVSYLADVGRGPELPLLIFVRQPFVRGVAFEIEERAAVANSFVLGDFQLSDKALVAQQHYSTGIALLAGEDSVSGLIDAAYMQFYLSIEATLEQHEEKKAVQSGQSLFGTDFDSGLQKIVSHVYFGRHRFFGHAHPKYLKGLLDSNTAFDIAKQTLVARWCARRLLELELKRPLAKREIRLYPNPGRSVTFTGDAESLGGEFALPK